MENAYEKEERNTISNALTRNKFFFKKRDFPKKVRKHFFSPIELYIKNVLIVLAYANFFKEALQL